MIERAREVAIDMGDRFSLAVATVQEGRLHEERKTTRGRSHTSTAASRSSPSSELGGSSATRWPNAASANASWAGSTGPSATCGTRSRSRRSSVNASSPAGLGERWPTSQSDEAILPAPPSIDAAQKTKSPDDRGDRQWPVLDRLRRRSARSAPRREPSTPGSCPWRPRQPPGSRRHRARARRR